jgi:hypothetical protein
VDETEKKISKIMQKDDMSDTSSIPNYICVGFSKYIAFTKYLDRVYISKCIAKAINLEKSKLLIT